MPPRAASGVEGADEEILSPFPDEQTSDETALTDRLRALSGANIALFSNNKRNSDHFLEGVGEHIATSAGAMVSEVFYKPVATSPAEDSLYEQLEEYDAVLIAYGDCGSCSSWTIHDAIQLEKAGVPTVVYCSDAFTGLGQYEAENQECPGLPIIEFEHPIADLAPEDVRTDRVTDAVCEETVQALTDSPEALVDRYKGRYIDEGADEPPETFGSCSI